MSGRNREIDKQINREKERQTDRQTDRQTEIEGEDREAEKGNGISVPDRLLERQTD